MLRIFGKTLIVLFALTVIANLAKADCPEGLVAYWSFDKDTINGETVADLCGDNDGQMINDPEVVNGVYGQALEFSGDNHVEVPDSDSLDIETGEVSVTVWVHINSATNYAGIVEKGPGSSTHTPFLLREWTDGTVQFDFRIDDDFIYFNSDSVVPPGGWTFLACTYDGKEAKIYIDGKLDISREYEVGFQSNDEPLMIGWDTFAENRHFNGIIDEVRVYKKALMKHEVGEAMLGTAVRPEGSLTVTWGMIKEK